MNLFCFQIYLGQISLKSTIFVNFSFVPELENTIAMIGFGTALQGYFDNNIIEKQSWIERKENLLPILVI